MSELPQRLRPLPRAEGPGPENWPRGWWLATGSLCCVAAHGRTAAFDVGDRIFLTGVAGEVFCEKHGNEYVATNGAKNRDTRQASVIAWVERTFGAHTLAMEERALRLIEEAVELAQACGLEEDRVRVIAHHVYSKPAGTIAQEVGQVGVTLIALAAVAGVSADGEEAAEVKRVFAIDPETFRKRHNLKAAAGIAVTVKESP